MRDERHRDLHRVRSVRLARLRSGAVDLWRKTISDDEECRISSIRTRQVTIQRGRWSPGQ